MPIVIAAIVLVGTLCVLNLLLTFGVVRRLRSHIDVLARVEAFAMAGDLKELRKFIGKPLPAFTSELPQLLGFFKVGCPACLVEAREFAKVAAGEGTTAMDVHAVVIGSGAESEALHELLGDVPTTVDPESSNLTRELDLEFVPSFFQLEADGVVLGAGMTVKEVLEPSQV